MNTHAPVFQWIEWVSIFLEIVAVFWILVGVVSSTARYFYTRIKNTSPVLVRYTEYRHALARTRQLAERWQKMTGRGETAGGCPDDAGKLLALAYPDRIGKLRVGSRSRYLLSGGRGAVLPENDPLCGTPFIAVARTNGRPDDAKIFLAAPVAARELEAVLGNKIVKGADV